MPDATDDSATTAVRQVAEVDRLLVATDFDGTLSPFVPRPEDARPTAAAAAAVNRLSASDGVTVALVSGRSVESLRVVASPPRGVYLLGSHGAEVCRPGETKPSVVGLTGRQSAALATVADGLRQLASRVAGAAVEEKPYSVVLHTRQVVDRSLVPHLVAEAMEVCQASGVRHTVGHEIIEAEVVTVNKGTALLDLVEETRADAVIYLGDDKTDENAFAALASHRSAVTVKVGEGATAARYRVADPEAVGLLLERLADALSVRVPS